MNTTPKYTPGPWRWQGEDYRGGWGWQMLVGPDGEGLIVGQGLDGGPSPHLRAHIPLDPELCVTGFVADGKPHAECVHVFSEANAHLIAAAPRLLEALQALLAVTPAKAPAADCLVGIEAKHKEAINAAKVAIAEALGKGVE